MEQKDEYELGDRCPTCRLSWFLFPPVRIVELEDKFQPSNHVRCIECKEVFNKGSIWELLK